VKRCNDLQYHSLMTRGDREMVVLPHRIVNVDMIINIIT
jgi:hypothetical protein